MLFALIGLAAKAYISVSSAARKRPDFNPSTQLWEILTENFLQVLCKDHFLSELTWLNKLKDYFHGHMRRPIFNGRLH